MAWLTNWNYRKSVTISNAGSALSDYQVLITVDTASLVTTGKMRSDCGDIRFTNDDGSTLLPYWIESGLNTASTKIWVKIPSIPTSKTIYMYYGNSSATSASNGANTFLFFDDFDDNSIDISKWTKTDTYGVTVVETGNVLKISGTTNSNGADDGRMSYIRSVATFGNVSFDVKMKNNSGDAGSGILQFWTTAGSYSTYGYFDNWAGWQYLGYYNFNFWWNSGDLFDPGNDGLSHLYSFRRIGTSLELWRDDILKTTKTNTNLGTGNINILLGAFARVPGNNVDAQFDDIRIRKYASPEPTFGVSGSEELGITAIDMILSTNTCAGSCQITADVTWQNLGSSNVTFRPTILIDGTTYAYATSDITIGPYPATGSSTITTPTLSIGTHQICPYPN